MKAPRVSLEQWRALIAVVEAGGYAQAAEALNKTQSTVSYAVQKIEQQLDVALFEMQGRKAQLTEAGKLLYRRAQALLDLADSLERGAAQLARGWEPEVRLAVEIIFPTWILLQALDRFGRERPDTRVQLHETVLGGTDELLLSRRVDAAICAHLPPGFLGQPLMPVRLMAAAHPEHPLHQLGRELTLDDLSEHRQLVVRDTATGRTRDAGGWQGAEQRWTVSHKATQIAAATRGMGFAWFAEPTIRREQQAGLLKPLPLREGGERHAHLYWIYPSPDYPANAAKRLEQIIREEVDALCQSKREGC